MDVIALTKALISCASITPKDKGAQAIVAQQLEPLGFRCHHLPFGEGAERTENLFARLGNDGPHLCFGGHTDVVPPGPRDQWRSDPFAPEIGGGFLYGRGASDMKGSIAAFIAAVAAFIEKYGAPAGSISLLITGDEEGDATHGTRKVLQWMDENGQIPDVALVGEPTNPARLGEEIKIGRRGSMTGYLSVAGKQGHVAYHQLADNPLPRLSVLLSILAQHEFDQGSEFFPPTNLELTTIDVGNTANNVIPAEGHAVFNVRFNDHWSPESLEMKIRALLDASGFDYDLELRCTAQNFLTEPGAWSDIVRNAVQDITGAEAPFTTSGGTSDARFFAQYCPVVEFGPINATIHQIDESIEISVLENLVKVYTRVIERYFAV